MLFQRFLAHLFLLAPVFLPPEPFFPYASGRFGRLANRSRLEGFSEKRYEFLKCIDLVHPLAARILGGDTQYAGSGQSPGKPVQQELPLLIREAGRRSDVEFQLDPGLDLVDILSARAAAARGGKMEFRRRDNQSSVDDNFGWKRVGHGNKIGLLPKERKLLAGSDEALRIPR